MLAAVYLILSPIKKRDGEGRSIKFLIETNYRGGGVELADVHLLPGSNRSCKVS